MFLLEFVGSKLSEWLYRVISDNINSHEEETMIVNQVGKAQGYREPFTQLIPTNLDDAEELYRLDRDGRGYVYGSRRPIREFLIPRSGRVDSRIAG